MPLVKILHVFLFFVPQFVQLVVDVFIELCHFLCLYKCFDIYASVCEALEREDIPFYDRVY